MSYAYLPAVQKRLLELTIRYRSTFRYYDVELRDSTSIPNRSHYHYDPVTMAFGLTIQIGEYEFRTDPTRLSELSIDDGYLARDFFWMSISGILSDDFEIHRIDLRLEDPMQTAFSNDLPPMSLELSDFSERSVVITGAGLQSFIHLDIQTLEPIPEPGTGNRIESDDWPLPTRIPAESQFEDSWTISRVHVSPGCPGPHESDPEDTWARHSSK